MILVWVPVAVLVLDRLTKWAVVAQMTVGESIPVLPGIFHLTYILNPGAAFGMLEGNRWFFLLVAFLAVTVIFFYRRDIKKAGHMTEWGAALFLGGTLGNVWDRAATGLVIDFFDFRVWPVFNVADIAICTGVGLIICSLIWEEKHKK